MKRILILFSLALCVVGCTIDNNEQSEIERDSLYSYIETVKYKGHHYVRFYDARHASISVLHDPDCPCHSKTLTEWQQLQLAIAITESRCNPQATGASQDAGILQITPIYAREASRLSSERTYSHNEAYDPKTSLEMFAVVQDYHNPEHDIDTAIRLHNKAPWYARKVKDNLEFVQRYEAVRSLL